MSALAWAEEWLVCAECGDTFDAAVAGGPGEHDDVARCGECTVPCHCAHCDPDAATDLALTCTPDWRTT